MIKKLTVLFLAMMLFLSIGCSSNSKSDSSTSQEQNQIEWRQKMEALNKYLYENFGGAGNPKYATSWYKDIKTIRLESVKNNRASIGVVTDYYVDKDPIVKERARAIAASIGNNPIIDVESVTVYGQNGIAGSWSFFSRK